MTKRVCFLIPIALVLMTSYASAANRDSRGTNGSTTVGQGAGVRTGRTTGNTQAATGMAGGTVMSINSAALSFTVQSGRSSTPVTVATTTSTTFTMSDGSSASFADLMVDAQVKVQGSTTGTNAVTAQQIQILGGAGSGKVTSVDAASLSFVVQPQAAAASPVTVSTSTTTVFQKSDGSTATFASLAKNEMVLVQSTSTGTNAASATRVLILQAGTSCSGTSGTGNVASVNSSARSFVVQGQNGPVTVTTSSATAFRTSNGSAASLASLSAGSVVQVKGTVTGSNTVDAQQVIIGNASTNTGVRGNRR